MRDNDGTPEVSVADAGSVDEGGTLEFPVRLSAPFHTRITVDYTLAGTAVAGVDHDGAASGTVAFAPGEMEKTIRLVTVDDGANEPEETVEVTLLAPDPSLATLGAVSRAAGRIWDGGLPRVRIAPVADVIVEGEDAEFIVTREGPLSEPLTFDYFVSEQFTAVARETSTIEAGKSAVRVSWPTQDNAFFSAVSSVFSIEVSLLGSYRFPGGNRAAVVVLDDDLPPVVSIADAGAVTEGDALAFPVTLTTPFSVQITVNWRLGGTAAAGDHDGGASGAVAFAPGETEKAIRIATVDDGVVEPEETVEVTLLAPDSPLATLGAATATGRILDDDGAVEVTVSAVSEQTVEGADAVFELARSGAVSGALDVSLRVADPDGVLASTAPSGARFGAGETTTTLRLATRNVAGAGSDAAVTVTLADGGAAHGLGTPSTATVTVRDDDTAPTVSIADAGDVVEGGVFAFPVTLSGPFNRRITVSFIGTPTFNAGDWGEAPSEHVDFVRNRLFIERGVTKQLLRMAAFQDGIDEADEPVTITLTSVSAGRLGRSTATGRILDSDRPLVKVGRVAGTVTEGEQAAFTFTRTGVVSETLEVSFAVTDSGAVLAGAPPTSVTFGAGDATATLRLDTVDDTVDEADATLTLALRPGAEYGVRAPDRARVTVRDDDLPVVTVAAEAATVAEGEDAVFTLTRTEGDLSQTLEVSFAVTDSGAVLAGAAPTGVTFGAGDATATLRIATDDDEVDEADAAVTLTLQAGADHVLGDPSTAAVTVQDDDATPGEASVEVSVADAAPVTEGGTLEFPVTLSAPFKAEITVDYRFGGGTATAGEDYGASASGTVTFAPRQIRRTIRLVTTDDAAAEPEEAVEVTLSLPVPDPGLATLGTATATGRILDDDGPPQVTVAAASATVTEGADAVFTLTRANGDASGALTVPVAVTDAGAVLAGAPPAGVTFEAGSLTATLRLGTRDEEGAQADATVTLALQAGPAHTLGDPSRATVTVRDGDLPVVTVATAADTVTEGEALEFTLTRIGNLSEELAVLIGFGIAPDLFIDLQIATFAAGAATTRLDRTAPDVGADTTYVLALSPGAKYVLGEPSRASVTVRDDDATPSVSIADADAVTEGGALEFPVTLSGPFHTEITVDWRVGDGGTATAGDDHAGAASGSVTFAPRVTERTIRIATTDDSADEPEETVEVALSLPDPDPGLATLGTAAATGRILDNDGPSQVTVAPVAATVAEGADAVFTLTRANGDVSGTLAVTVAVTDAGAVLAGAAPASVTFEAGASTATLRLATDDDAADEADTLVTLTLETGADYSLGAPSAATVTVRDDDLPSVTVAADAAAVTEGEAAVFTLTRAGDLSVLLAVPVAVTDADGVLAEEAPVSVTFEVDAATAALRLATDDDAADEADAPVTLTLEAGPGHDPGDTTTATVTVRDNDLPSVTVAADAATVTEGAAAAFTLTRTGDLSVPLEVSVLFGDADSVLLPGAPAGVTFEVDAATAALRPGTDDDDTDEADAVVTLTLQGGAGYDLGDPSVATVTVRDNDLPVVTVAAVSERIVEGEPIRFTVTRTGDLSAALTVTTLFGTSPNALSVESDITIRAGESTGRAGGAPAPDSSADTTYWLGLKTSLDYRPGEPALAMVTALDHQQPPEVSVADADAAPEGGALEFPVTLSRPFHQSLTVAYTLGGTAAAADYTDAAGGAVTFAPGTIEQTIRIATVDDGADEAEEAVTVTLADGDDYHVGTPATATGRILDDDGPSQVTVAAVAATVTEGTDAEFVLTRTGDLSGAQEVSFTVEDAAGVLASPPPTGVTFEPGATTMRVTLATVDDLVDEADAVLTLTLLDGTGYGLGAQPAATVTVRDDDAPPAVSIADAGSVTEGDPLDYVVRLSHPSAAEIPVRYTLGGTAQAADYTDAAGGVVTFAPETTERTVRLATVDDDADEAEETVEVTLVAPDPALATLLGTPIATGTIEDDDLPVVTAAADAATVTEGADAAFTLTRAGDLSVPLEVSFTVEDAGGALAPGAPAGATFGVGAATAPVTLASADDGVDEADADVVLVLQADATAAWRAGSPSRATVTVEDDDLPVVTAAAAADAVAEGADAVFTLTRTEGELSQALEVSFTIEAAAGVLTSTAPSTVTFGATEATATLRLGTQDDTATGDDAAVTLTLADGAAWNPGDPRQASVAVRDNDARPSVSIADAGSAPEGGTLEFPVTLSGPFHSEIVVDTVFGGTASAGDDHAAVGGAGASVTFAPGEVRKVVSRSLTDDDVDEPEETVEVTLTLPAPDPGHATLGRSVATGRIQDNDLPVVTAAAEAAAVTEGADAVFILTRAGDRSVTLDVSFEVTDADGVLAARAPSSVTFGVDAATATLRLGTRDDTADGPDAPLTLTLLLDTGYRLGDPSTATVTVEDDDLPVVTVAAEAATVTEGEDVVFTLTRAGVLSEALEVPVAVTDADGVLASAAPSSVTFGAGAATATLRLPTRDDTADNPDATVTLALAGGADHAPGAPSQAVVTVRDDELRTVSVADAAPVTEGGTLEFPVTLSNRSAAAITVAWVVAGVDGAVRGTDYADVRLGFVTFAPGEVRKVISLATLDDDVIEREPEGVQITLSAPDAALATLDRAEAEGRILDDDLPIVTIAWEREQFVEREPLRFTLTRTGDLSLPLTVEVLVGINSDPTILYSTFTFQRNVSTLRSVYPLPSGVIADTTWYLGLGQSDDFRPGEPSVAMTRVLDHDAAPEVSVADAEAVAEGGTLEFAVTLSGPYRSEVTVDYTLGGTAMAGTDYEGAASGTVTFAPNAMERTIRLATTDDAAEGPEETVEVTLSLPASGSGGATLGAATTARGRILDNDATPEVSVADAGAVSEGGELAFPVTLTGPYHSEVTVDYTLGGTAVAGTDYEGAATGAVTFAPGTIERAIRLATTDDDADGPDRTVEVTLSLPVPDPGVATLGTSTATGTILDDDLPVVTVAADTDTVTEGEDAVFTLTRAGVVSEALAVSLAVADADGVLVSTAPTGVTFGAGAATATLRLGTRDDTVDEPDATVTLALTDGAGYRSGDPSTAAVTVRDDDSPNVSIADAAPVTEGGTLEFAVRLSTRFDTPVTVGYRLGGSAAQGEDYAGAMIGSVTFAPGVTERTLRIVTVDDAADEPEERVLVTLAAPAPPLTLGRSVATGRILDDDFPVVTVVAADSAITEGADAVFALTRTGAVSEALVVTVAVADTAGVLVSAAPTRVTFGPGAAMVTRRLGTRADAVDKADSPLTLTVVDGAGWTPGDPSEATVTVRDDDPVMVTVAAVADAVLEGEAAAFTLTRTPGDRSAALTVAVSVTDADSALVSAAPSTVTFGAGDATAELSLDTREDTTGDVDVVVTLTVGAGAGYVPGDPSTAAVTVREDDLPLVSIADAGTVTEGGALEFVVSMPHSNDVAVPVAWRLGGTASAGADYAGGGFGALVFAPGETRKVITVTTVDDSDVEQEETVEAAIFVASPGLPGLSTEATGRIRDNEPRDDDDQEDDDQEDDNQDGDLPVVTLDVADYWISQGERVPFVLELKGDRSESVTVRVVVTEGRSFWKRGSGGTSGNIDITFPLNINTYRFRQDYSLAESSEDYRTSVRVDSRPSYARGTPHRATVLAVVAGRDPRVTIAGAPRVSEGGDLTFEVRLDIPSDQEIRVEYRLAGTAVAGEDYSGGLTTRSVTFMPGDTFEEITLETLNDRAAEPEETVEVELVVGDDAGVALGSSTRATGHIRRSDTPVVTVAAVSEWIVEGGEAVFTLTRRGSDLSAPLTVDTILIDGTSPSPAATPFRANFGSSDATTTLRLTTRDDAVVKADAAVLLALLDGEEYDLGDPSRAVVTVRDDDLRPEVSIADAAAAREGGTLEFPVRLSASAAATVTVGYSLAGTATAGADYAGGASGTVTFAPGTTERAIRVATLADGVDEPEESVRVNVVTVAVGGFVEVVTTGGGTATGAILDIDLPSVTVAPVAAVVTEGEDAAFTLTRAGDLSAPLEVSFAIQDAAGVLSSAAPSGATFAADAATARITLATDDDEADEADAALTLTLQADADYDRGDPHQATVTVRDDDPWAVTVAPAAATVTEGEDAEFVLTRAGGGDLSAALTVSFAVEDAAGVLASAAPSGATFEAGAATARVTLATVDDEADEADAALTLTLRPGAGYDRGDPSAATVTVRDDELPVVTVAAVADRIAEGAAVAFTLTRTGDPSATLEVPVAVTDAGSALANAAPSTVTFGAGDATAVLRLATADDATVEAETAVTLTLREGAGHVLGEPSSATVTVRDNDTRPDVSIANAESEPVTEGETLVFPVTLNVPYGEEIRIFYHRGAGSTATEGVGLQGPRRRPRHRDLPAGGDGADDPVHDAGRRRR